jgi:hypothetical protein
MLSSRDIGGHEMVFSKRNLKDDPAYDAYDEESPPDRWFTPSSVDVAGGTDDELPKTLRLFRSYLFKEFTVWGTPVNILMYSSYVKKVTMMCIYFSFFFFTPNTNTNFYFSLTLSHCNTEII